MSDRLVVTGLRAGYGETEILRGVSLSLAAGETLGVLGRNGAGKTTLLASIMGLTTHLGGTISLGDKRIDHALTHLRCRSGLGYVPQSRDIFASLTVEENLRAGTKSYPVADGLARAYALFPRLRERSRHGGAQLSGGEQQMLSIARALMGRPRLLLLDEPLEGLAPPMRAQVMQSIRTMTQTTGIGCLLVEQHVDIVLEFSTNVLVLENGCSVFLGPSATLRTDPDILDNALGLRNAAPPV